MKRTTIGRMVAALVVAAAGVAMVPSAAQAAITPAAAVPIKAAHSNKCLNVKGGSLENSAVLIQYYCSDSFANDKWRVVPKTGGYQIVNNLSGKCLNVPNGKTDNNVQIIQYTCADTATNNLWKFEPVSGRTTYRIRSVGTNKCLNVYNNLTADSTAVNQYTCSTAATALNDQFYFPPATSASITPLAAQARTPLVAVQGGAGTGATLGPIVYAYLNDQGRAYRAYQENPDSPSSIVWEAIPSADPTLPNLDQWAGHATLATQADGRVQIGLRSTADGDVNLSTQTAKGANTYGSFADVGGTSAAQPVTGKTPDGKLVTFSLVNGSLWHLPQDGTHLPYGGWRQIGGSNLVGEPALVTIRDGIRVFALDTAGAVQTAVYRNGALGDFTSLGGSGFTGTPAAVAVTGYYTRVVVRDAAGQLVLKGEKTDGTFDAAWTPVGGFVAAGSPDVVMDPLTGALAVVARADDTYVHSVFETVAGSNVWNDVAPVERAVATDPTVVTYNASGGQTWGYTVRDDNLVPYLYSRTDVRPSALSAAARAKAASPAFTEHALPKPPVG
ncbi:RICIN domain-containing protein [Actinoplanes sp. RD1]|uniref:RICIN domain-containing protein n=1 Tax=Actinoplanes sp. RD1 TaxID=3064538 RepID=UPI00274193F2|nr:RICIN domain-containing protein [Actinoplanes sp. RD1]